MERLKPFNSRTSALAAVLAVAMVLALFVPGTTVQAETDVTASVQLMVELASPGDDRVVREAARKIRRLTDRAPREYTTHDGQRRKAGDLRRFRIVTVAAEDSAATLARLNANPAVVSARPVHEYVTAQLPSDTRYPEQYALAAAAASLAGISAPAAWDVTTGSSATVIAIVDGGVDFTHEDLRDKAWQNPGEIAGNSIDDDGNGYLDDVHGWDFVSHKPAAYAIDHATHVAGLAAASSNNGVGITGVDWQARIMSVRVLSASGVGSEDRIIDGINYAVAQGADIINLSLVGSASAALQAAVENAYAAGVVVIAAAGNSGRDTTRYPLYPVCADRGGENIVLGVAATNDRGEPASFSNWGTCIDIAAPGDDLLSTKTGDRYGEMSGTSMSAPVAAGVAGLYLALHPGASPADVIAALRAGDSFTGEKSAEWSARYRAKLNAAMVVGTATSSVQKPAPVSTPLPESGSGQDHTDSAPEQSGDQGGGGGGGDSSDGGGGGSDGGESAAAEPGPAPRVAGTKTFAYDHRLLVRVKDTFRYVFGRLPTTLERSYWDLRVKQGDKRNYEALLGAMRWGKLTGRTYDPHYSGLGRGSSPRVAGAVAGSLVTRINALHRSAFGRNPTVSEHTYWLGRVTSGDKTTEAALLGAMLWHRAGGITH